MQLTRSALFLVPSYPRMCPRPPSFTRTAYPLRRLPPPRSVKDEELKETETETETNEVEQVTKKWGLEAGLWKAMTSKKEDGSKSNTAMAADLLKKYGSAYLITSISFAIVSFAICYLLVDIGVDVSSLLAKVGITASDAGEKVGKVAIAYAAHKAASPIRFPPTVALTPVVANWIGKKYDQDSDQTS